MGNDIVGVFVVPAVDVQVGEGLGVAVGRDDLAALQSLSADGADLVAGIAVFRAGGFLGIAQLGLVAQCGDHQLLGGSFFNALRVIEVLSTCLAVVVCRVARLGAGGILRLHQFQLAVLTNGDEHAQDLCAEPTDLAAVFQLCRLRIHDVKLNLLIVHGVELGPVELAGVMVEAHGLLLVAFRCGLSNDGVFAGFQIQAGQPGAAVAAPLCAHTGEHHISIAVQINGKAQDIVHVVYAVVCVGDLTVNLTAGIRIQLTRFQVHFIQLLQEANHIHLPCAVIIRHLRGVELVHIISLLVLHLNFSPLQRLKIHGEEPAVVGVAVHGVVHQLGARNKDPIVIGGIRHQPNLLGGAWIGVLEGIPVGFALPRGKSIQHSRRQIFYKAIEIHRLLIVWGGNRRRGCRRVCCFSLCRQRKKLRLGGRRAVLSCGGRSRSPKGRQAGCRSGRGDGRHQQNEHSQ